MKQESELYDVMVLGFGLGGLVAATRLLKEHHTVILLKEKKHHLSCQADGYRFLPFSNFSERLIKRALLERVSKELGFPLLMSDRGEDRQGETKWKKPKQKVAFQVILPKARIDLFSQRSMLQRELKREFPNEVGPIEDFYDEMERLQHLLKEEKAKERLESVFPIERRSWIKKWWPFAPLPKGKMEERLAPFSKEFREFIRLQMISWANLRPDRFPITLANYLLCHGEPDEEILEIDLEGLKERILGRFVQAGGRIEEVEGVERAERGWRKGFTLSLRGDGGAVRSKFLIINSPLQHLSNLLGRKARLLLKWRERIQPRYLLLPLFLGVREKIVPVGMENLLVSILDLNKPYEGGNLLFLSLSQKGDETEAPEGRRALIVESLMSPEKWDSDLFAEHQKGVMAHLYHLFPFLEGYIELTNWDWAREQCSCWSYPHFIYETHDDFQWREGIVPHRISKNFYFIGKENFPHLGIEGEVLSGLIVAKEILEKYS